jgi:hypothetical protein
VGVKYRRYPPEVSRMTWIILALIVLVLTLAAVKHFG